MSNFLNLPGERISLGDATIDTVVSTFTMCTIPGVDGALRGVARVLKLGGQLIFYEHVLASRSSGATMAGASRAIFQIGIRGLPYDPAHSVAPYDLRVHNRTTQ